MTDRNDAFAQNKRLGDIITVFGEQYEVVAVIEGDPVDEMPRDQAGKFDQRGFEVTYDSDWAEGEKAVKLSSISRT